MKLKFTKMQGCGNDYIYINGFEKEIDMSENLVAKLSDRHFGIGGDGVVLILPSKIADARMRIFNRDGSEAGMCGNAIRCVGKYLYENGIVTKRSMNVETLSGVRKLDLFAEGAEIVSVRVNMGAVELEPKNIPVKLCGDRVVSHSVEIGGEEYAITCVSLGNPHAVVFCDSVDDIDLHRVGPLFENDALFPERVNVEFAEVIGKNHLKMRVWERGSGETLACGTGACAAAVAGALSGYCEKDAGVKVALKGGELIISYTDEAVFMTGECKKVFDGEVEI